MSARAYFCKETGVRIAAPGVSKAVDSKNGQREVKPPPIAVSGTLEDTGELAQAREQRDAAVARVAELEGEVSKLTALTAQQSSEPSSKSTKGKSTAGK